MPDLAPDQLSVALLVVAGVALASLFVALVLALRLRTLRNEYAILRADGGEQDIVATAAQLFRRIDAVDRRVDHVVAEQQEQAAMGRWALQKFGLVRYDAFDDAAGQLSFSAALLDDHGDGLVITSINGRSETRSYAKAISGLSSRHNLSDEERQAINEAVSGSTRGESRASVPS